MQLLASRYDAYLEFCDCGHKLCPACGRSEGDPKVFFPEDE